jgi:hypothetical protein
MASNWKNATCERCTFRVDSTCRRFPPSASEATAIEANYPMVRDYFDNQRFMPACAEYQEEGDKVSQVVRDACLQIFREPLPREPAFTTK